MKKNIMLVGLGPHAKRIYINYFKKNKINLKLVVDLDSQKKQVRNYLDENGFETTELFTIEDEYKDSKHLPLSIGNNLKAICQMFGITHIIIATEPKAHFMYLEFALKNNINVLTDKPITVSKNMTSIKSINQVRNDYYKLLKLANESKASCNVMCQRQYHKGYEYIKNTLKDVVKKYKVPITFINIYYCDGNWEMPHDLDKENHPYKYGYGELYHSGYHFIDLLSDLLKINRELPNSKIITKGEVYSNCFTPTDEIGVFNIEDYKRIFKDEHIPDYYHNNPTPKFKKYGEKNYYGMLKFKNRFNQLITTVNLDLLHYGFSRRGWIESRDYYKSNGRIRHESINIQIGSLMNIQVHSYQSKEIKDRENIKLEQEAGGLEHFDIDIYRNVDVIGGKPFERIKLGDLYSKKEKSKMLGYNEQAREDYLAKFIKGEETKGSIQDQALGIEILFGCSFGIHDYYNKKTKEHSIKVNNEYTFPINIKQLKSYSSKVDKNREKKIINRYQIFKKEYSMGVFRNHIKNNNHYDVYCFIENDKEIASTLLYKEIKSYIGSLVYFIYLCIIIKIKNIYSLSKKCVINR